MKKRVIGIGAGLWLALSAGVAMAGTPSPEVYGFKVDPINRDETEYPGRLYLLTGPDEREQYLIVRDVSGAVAIVRREVPAPQGVGPAGEGKGQ